MAQQSSSNDGIELSSSSSVNNQSNGSNTTASASNSTATTSSNNSGSSSSSGSGSNNHNSKSSSSNNSNTNNLNSSKNKNNSSNNNNNGTTNCNPNVTATSSVGNGSSSSASGAAMISNGTTNNNNNAAISSNSNNMMQQQHLNLLSNVVNNGSNNESCIVGNESLLMTKPTVVATQPPPLIFPHNNNNNSNNNNNHAKYTPMLHSHIHPHQQLHNPLQHPHSHPSQHHHPYMPKVLENLVIYENFDVHETHRIEDGVCTHFTRLPPKKQELLKQFGIQSNQTVTYYEKYLIIENFIKFCNEYKISDHRPFLDFHESALPKCEQLKFVRYLGQGLPHLTLNRIYSAFKDVLGINRLEKIMLEGYNLEAILKKKRKNICNRMHAAAQRDNSIPMNPTIIPGVTTTTAASTSTISPTMIINSECLQNSLNNIESAMSGGGTGHLVSNAHPPPLINSDLTSTTPTHMSHFHSESNFNFHYSQ